MMRVSGHTLIAVESLFFQLLETFVFHLLHEGVGVSLFFLDLFLFHGTGSKGMGAERLFVLLFVPLIAFFLKTIWCSAGGSCHASLVFSGIQQDAPDRIDELVVGIRVRAGFPIPEIRRGVSEFLGSKS